MLSGLKQIWTHSTQSVSCGVYIIQSGVPIQSKLSGIATGVPVSFLSVGGNVSVFATSLLDTINFLDEMDHPPTVMTTSYGDVESNFGGSMAASVFPGSDIFPIV
jgi:hypothetical protein